MNKKSTYIVLALIIIITLIGIMIVKNNYNITTQDQNNNTKPVSSGMRVEDNAIYVSDQKPGNTLVVSIAVLKEPGFVIIHKDNNGTPKDIIGISDYLHSGEYTNIEIKLTTPMQNGQKLYAMIHKDDGDQKYSAVDLAVQSKIGGPIMMIFSVDKNVSDQPTVSL